MSTPVIGEGYRGVEGHIGYLLRQATYTLRGALDATLRRHGLTAPQYSVLSVLARDPGSSGADLARACNTTPQAMNGVLATLERDGAALSIEGKGWDGLRAPERAIDCGNSGTTMRMLAGILAASSAPAAIL